MNKKVKLGFTITLLLISVVAPFANATTFTPTYSGAGTSYWEWNGVCPDTYAYANADGNNKVAVYAGGYTGDVSAWVYALYTPATTGSYNVQIDHTLTWWLDARPSGGAYLYVKIRVETSGGSLVGETTVSTKQAISSGPVTGGPTSYSNIAYGFSLTAGTQYKLMAKLNGLGTESGRVGQDNDHPCTQYVSDIIVSGGGGCPVVYSWDGGQFVRDNNLLSESENKTSLIDVNDWYLLQKVPVSISGKSTLMIKEIDQDNGYLNQVKLLSVDHALDTNIAVTSAGEIVTYKNLLPPKSVQVEGIEIAETVTKLDKIKYSIPANTYTYIDFGKLSMNGPSILLLQTVGRKSPLGIQIKDNQGVWETIDTFWTKTDNALFASKISGWKPDIDGHYLMRISSSTVNEIDYIAINTTPQSFCKVKECNLIQAQHSKFIDVFTDINIKDNQRVNLLPGESILLTFESSASSYGKVDFVLYTQGYYIVPHK